MALTVPLPAPRYWQTRHQHWRTPIGASASIANRTAPQRHPPVIAIAAYLHARDNRRKGRALPTARELLHEFSLEKSDRYQTRVSGSRQTRTAERRCWDGSEAQDAGAGDRRLDPPQARSGRRSADAAARRSRPGDFWRRRLAFHGGDDLPGDADDPFRPDARDNLQYPERVRPLRALARDRHLRRKALVRHQDRAALPFLP